MDQLLFILTLLAALGSGLVAGIFFAFSNFVMRALGRLPAPQGIAAMQSINVVVLNPVFLGAFLGTGLASLALVVLSLLAWQEPAALYHLAGAVLYVVGCIGVTMAFNVPRNEALKAAKPDSAEGARLWQHYLVEWTAWNSVRTVASLLAAAAFTLALC